MPQGLVFPTVKNGANPDEVANAVNHMGRILRNYVAPVVAPPGTTEAAPRSGWYRWILGPEHFTKAATTSDNLILFNFANISDLVIMNGIVFKRTTAFNPSSGTYIVRCRMGDNVGSVFEENVSDAVVEDGATGWKIFDIGIDGSERTSYPGDANRNFWIQAITSVVNLDTVTAGKLYIDAEFYFFSYT